MASRDEHRIDAQQRLKWVVVGPGPAPRSEADMRAIVDWIDRAVEAWRVDPDGFDGAMLQAMFDGLFTVAAIRDDGALDFQLTADGRARVDSMPHDLSRLTRDGIQ